VFSRELIRRAHSKIPDGFYITAASGPLNESWFLALISQSRSNNPALGNTRRPAPFFFISSVCSGVIISYLCTLYTLGGVFHSRSPWHGSFFLIASWKPRDCSQHAMPLFVRVLSSGTMRRYGRVKLGRPRRKLFHCHARSSLYHTFWVLTLDQIAGNYSNGLLRDIKILIRAEKCDFGAFFTRVFV
jgi:hypothetical protein